MNVGTNDFPFCPYSGNCVFRTRADRCSILTRTDFPDGRCHFQKEDREDSNLYDAGLNYNGVTKLGARRQMIATLYSQGMEVDEIASRTGISKRTVYRHLTLMNLMR